MGMQLRQVLPSPGATSLDDACCMLQAVQKSGSVDALSIAVVSTFVCLVVNCCASQSRLVLHQPRGSACFPTVLAASRTEQSGSMDVIEGLSFFLLTYRCE
jgi:hypothetical protein